MTQHTPGPWKASEIDEFGDISIVPEVGGLAIAAVVNGEFMEMGGHGDEHTANAVLIAAAPELLAAIKEAAGWLRNGDYDTRGGLIEMSRIAGICEAAIAKALPGRQTIGARS